MAMWLNALMLWTAASKALEPSDVCADDGVCLLQLRGAAKLQAQAGPTRTMGTPGRSCSNFLNVGAGMTLEECQAEVETRINAGACSSTFMYRANRLKCRCVPSGEECTETDAEHWQRYDLSFTDAGADSLGSDGGSDADGLGSNAGSGAGATTHQNVGSGTTSYQSVGAGAGAGDAGEVGDDAAELAEEAEEERQAEEEAAMLGPTCSDGLENGDETGIDCGGSCEACPTCSDGQKNGAETGVDCGGSCPTACRYVVTDAPAPACGPGLHFIQRDECAQAAVELGLKDRAGNTATVRNWGVRTRSGMVPHGCTLNRHGMLYVRLDRVMQWTSGPRPRDGQTPNFGKSVCKVDGV